MWTFKSGLDVTAAVRSRVAGLAIDAAPLAACISGDSAGPLGARRWQVWTAGGFLEPVRLADGSMDNVKGDSPRTTAAAQPALSSPAAAIFFGIFF
ncbi:unnamed protein product [Lota lota]